MNALAKRPSILLFRLLLLVAPFSVAMPAAVAEDLVSDPRPPANDHELKTWLENMIWYHRFSDEEIRAATGLTPAEVEAARQRWQLDPSRRPEPLESNRLVVLPYPGGRHPRIGFLEGAIRPQRETKLSVFTPWDPASYVVLDVPEAIWSNLGLTYLAHTHIPTIWDERNMTLPAHEWQVTDDGTFSSKRTLPNGIAFGTEVHNRSDHLSMHMWLTNGTDHALSDLRVQNCVMLKAAKGFEQQTNDNKRFSGPYVACHSLEKDRWIIVAWDPLHRAWGNAPCPCLHSDPQFPDCAPGETRHLRGWFSFYQGTDIDAELARIDATGWKTSN
jgi:hypothetical protein